MNQILKKAGLLALSTGSFVYLYHTKWSLARVLAATRDDAQELTAEYCSPGDQTEGRAKVPSRSARDGPLVLQLQQVQVLFRHGARTPMRTIPKVSEVAYDADFFIREHQASVFPYERVSCDDGCPQDWSEYELSLINKPLRGDALAGQLTTYGKEQMYMLGLKLRDCYRLRLDIACFDPSEIRIMSSSVRRTVESAQGVLAGLYGKEQLNDFANTCGPVQICISDPCYNILIPNTYDCEVLKKNNYSTLVNSDHIEGVKEQRLEVESYINKPREKLLEAVAEAQARINSALLFYENEGSRPRRLAINRHRQHYQHDITITPLFVERSRAIAKVDRFWANVLNRDETVGELITIDDMRALVYLRNMEVEQFEGTLTAGYRIHLYFDKNPYFFNTHLCKEIFTKVDSAAPPSKQTPIMWKPGRKLVPDDVDDMEEDAEDEDESDTNNCNCSCRAKANTVTRNGRAGIFQSASSDNSTPTSFFEWFTRPTFHESDPVGPAIAGEVWRDPQTVMENEPKVRDPWDKKLNFVFSWDDTSARIAHGWPYPPAIRRFRKLIDKNAAKLLCYSMAGETSQARTVITRLSAGPLLTEMVDQARKFVCGKKGLKLCLYSSHDNTMAAMLNALCMWDDQWPPFASELRLELYREASGCGCDYYVRVLYNGKEHRIRGQTESYMHWTDFCNAIKRFTIRQDELERICRSNILERIAQEVLRYGTPSDKDRKEDPTGM